jgi:hypothetical protein
MMFVFASVIDGELNLVQNSKGHVYTWPTEKIAREYFEVATCEAHLYQVTMDLSVGRLIAKGEHPGHIQGPDEIYPDDDQKRAMFDSYVYKSLLEWTPLEQTIEVPS